MIIFNTVTKKVYKEFNDIREICYSPEWDRESKKDYFTLEGRRVIRVYYTENGIEKIVWHFDGTPANVGNGTIKKEIEEKVKNEIIKMKREKERSNQAFNKAIEFAKLHNLIAGNEIEINYTEPEILQKQDYKLWVSWNEEKKCYVEITGGTWNNDFKTDSSFSEIEADWGACEKLGSIENYIIQTYGRLPEKGLKKLKKYIADFENKTIGW